MTEKIHLLSSNVLPVCLAWSLWAFGYVLYCIVLYM